TRPNEPQVLGVNKKIAELVHSIAAPVGAIAVADLMDDEVVGDEDAAVALVPSVAVRNQIQPSQSGGECAVELVVEGKVGAAPDEPQERRVPLECNRPVRIRNA